MSCNSEADKSPSWLKLTSAVESFVGECNVRRNSRDEHHISAENISGLPYIIEVESTCVTQFVRYATDVNLGAPQAEWKTSFNVPICPGWRAREGAGAAARLTSLGPASREQILTTLTWKVVGDAFASNNEQLPVQVRTY